jgi:hypothetical protein
MEILIYYILPNLALFGSIYVFAKLVENAFQFVVENYDEYADGKLLDKINNARNKQ